MFLGEMNCPEDGKQEESQPSKDMGEEAGGRGRIEHISCSMEYDSALKKNKMLPYAASWIQLEIIIWNKVSQKEKDIYMYIYVILFICRI